MARVDNLILLHPNWHRQVHSAGLVVVKTASPKGVCKGLIRMRETRTSHS